MSQEIVSQKLKRTCDGCGSVVEWEMIGLQEATIIEMQEWYTIIREVFVEGRFVKIMVQACSLACTPAAAIKLALPKMREEPADNIDLAALRVSDLN
jgi:hypothetical protein